MGVCTKIYSSRIRRGSVPIVSPKESDGGLYQVLLLKNQMEGLYQVLLLENQMGVCTKFYS
jgi:hypothetical protein